MKVGCCLNMIASTSDGIGLEHIHYLKKLGYDYAELPLAQIMALPEDEFRHLLVTVEEAGIPCEACNNFFPSELRLTGKDVDSDKIDDYVGKALERARKLGTKIVVFGSGKAKNIPEEFPLNEGYTQIVELLRRIAPIAREKNIVIVIEPLRKEECNLINTFKEGCQLADCIETEEIRVLVDFYHLTQEGESIEYLKEHGVDYLRHVHFANPQGRVYPTTIDEADYGPFIEALKAIQYDARISCEAYSKDFLLDGSNALCFLKQNLL